MRRLHLAELEDQPWFPATIRNSMTDLLDFFIRHFRVYDSIVPILHNALKEASAHSILDLCSGGAGAIQRVQQILAQEHDFKVEIILSDLYPNKHAYERLIKLRDSGINYLSSSVDATKVPQNLTGFRTLFTSFHHFDSHDARKILSNAVKQGHGIAIFELSERSFRGALGPLFSAILSFFITPFLRPFSLKRIFYTYVVPIIPAAYLFDGLVSQLRSYTPEEMFELARNLGDKEYKWEAGFKKHDFLPFKINYLVGYKASDSALLSQPCLKLEHRTPAHDQ
jgi:hypothetical protein